MGVIFMYGSMYWVTDFSKKTVILFPVTNFSLIFAHVNNGNIFLNTSNNLQITPLKNTLSFGSRHCHDLGFLVPGLALVLA